MPLFNRAGGDWLPNENGPSTSSTPLNRCDARCVAERKICSRDMQKWSRNMLVLIGLEQVSRRAAGSEHWSDLEKAVKVSTSHPKDFNPKTKEKECCLWCGANRIAGCPSEVPNFKILMSDGKFKPSGRSFGATSADCGFSDVISGFSCSDSSLLNCSTAVGERSPPCSPLSMCSAKSFSSSNSTCKESTSSLNFEHIFDSSKRAGNSTNETFQNNKLEHNRLAAALRLLPGLPLLSNPALFGLWMSSSPSSSMPDQHDISCESVSFHNNAFPSDAFNLGEGDLVQRFAQWQTQLMALNMMSGLFSTDSTQKNGFAESTELSRNSCMAPFFYTPTTNYSAESMQEAADEDKPLDLSSNRNQCGEEGKQKSSVKVEDLRKREQTAKHSVIKKIPKKLAKDLKAQDGAEWLSPELHKQPSSSATAINPKLHLLGTKRNYTQADLDAAVLDIRMGRLGTRRASVVYGIPRSTLRNKIYKLEALEDNGDGSSKRRRLNAYALRKKEKNSLQVLKRSISKSLLNADDGGATPKKMGIKRVKMTSSPVTDLLVMPVSPALKELVESPLALTKKSISTTSSGSPQIIADTSLPSLNSFSEMLKQYVEKLDEVEKESTHDSITPPTEHSGDDDAGTDSKRPRPKRGQYRKYDKGALEKAVASVRSGEMSVHRAGSFYGVPHSTLEYKVKERNLLRHKNRGRTSAAGGSKTSPEPVTCSTPKSTSVQSSMDSGDVILDTDIKLGVDEDSSSVAEVVEAVGSGALLA